MPYKHRILICTKCKVEYMGIPISRYCSRRCSKLRPLAERLANKTQILKNGCWRFTGALNNDGYGSIGKGGVPGSMLAHRAAYLIAFGSLPNNLEICHHCDNPSCINPAHLFAATHKENFADAKKKGRTAYPMKNVARGIRNGGNKYPVSTILKIKELGGNMTNTKIARLTGVSVPLVYRILSGKIWKSL